MNVLLKVFLLTFSIVLATSCEQQFAIKGKALPVVPPPPAAAAKVDNSLKNAIKITQPALAVRGMGCLMCHANVQSNIITDFGWGNDYFYNIDSSGNIGSLHYSRTWENTPVVKGDVFVPRVDLKDAKYIRAFNVVAPKTSITIREAFIKRQGASSTIPGAVGDGHTPNPSTDPQIIAKRGVIEKNEIYIGAPTRSELLDIYPALKEKESNPFKAQIVDLNEGKIIWDSLQELQVTANSGLVIKKGASQTMGQVTAFREYVTNQSSDWNCNGDILIRGILVLKDLKLKTVSGCRLYVTDTVFIQGGIQYTGLDVKQNIQITSSRGVYLGMNAGNISGRFSHNDSVRDWSWSALQQATYQDAQTLVNTLEVLLDSSEAASLAKYTNINTENGVKSLIPYSHLVLNAPMIHSRYVGDFKGVVIAEISMFALGNFKFTFDSLFIEQEIEFFPFLKKPILSITKD